MEMIKTFIFPIAVAGFAIIFFFFAFLMNLYLALGTAFPELSIRIDQKIRKVFNKPPVIILDPGYIRKRNFKWFIWVFVSTHAAVLALILFLKSVG